MKSFKMEIAQELTVTYEQMLKQVTAMVKYDIEKSAKENDIQEIDISENKYLSSGGVELLAVTELVDGKISAYFASEVDGELVVHTPIADYSLTYKN